MTFLSKERKQKKIRKPRKARCALCKKLLQAIPARSRAGLRKLSKTQKRPERVFGGVLCTQCVQQLIKEKTRLKAGVLKREGVPLSRLKYIDALKKI